MIGRQMITTRVPVQLVHIMSTTEQNMAYRNIIY